MVSDREIEHAVAVLRAGGLVAFPTETVYGLGADASNPDAIRRVFDAKGRPHDHPLIVHVSDAIQIANWARSIPEAAHALAKRFWPGPLTLILKRAPGVNDLVSGGQDTVALRVPSHPVAQTLLRKFGGGIAAPSANRFGRVSATTADHVRSEFGAEVACVLNGGAADLGIESTIVDLSGAEPALLRPGAITPAQLEAALGTAVAPPGVNSPRVPGALARHYAPRTPLLLLEKDLLLELAATLAREGKHVAVLARSVSRPVQANLHWIAAPREAVEYAHDLYANLRDLDAPNCDAILVETPPPVGAEWAAIRDRLMRAAAGAASAETT
jgi:L-threonylcarbamoyladenylate synthase